jgi:hypothetical protein
MAIQVVPREVIEETTPDGHTVRRKKEKTLGAASKARHEAIQQLAEYIAEHTGKLTKQGESISMVGELLDGIERGEVPASGRKDQGEPSVPLCEARPSPDRSSENGRCHVDARCNCS